MGRYTYLPIRYYHDTWLLIRYVAIFLKEFRFYKYCDSILLCVVIFSFFVFNSRPWENMNVLNIQTVTIKKKNTHVSSHYCDSILQFIVIFVCLLKTRQWKIVDYTLKRDCIWWVILTKTMNHIFLNFYFRSIHIHSVYLKYLEPWNFKVPKPWTCTWI